MTVRATTDSSRVAYAKPETGSTFHVDIYAAVQVSEQGEEYIMLTFPKMVYDYDQSIVDHISQSLQTLQSLLDNIKYCAQVQSDDLTRVDVKVLEEVYTDISAFLNDTPTMFETDETRTREGVSTVFGSVLGERMGNLVGSAMSYLQCEKVVYKLQLCDGDWVPIQGESRSIDQTEPSSA